MDIIFLINNINQYFFKFIIDVLMSFINLKKMIITFLTIKNSIKNNNDLIMSD